MGAVRERVRPTRLSEARPGRLWQATLGERLTEWPRSDGKPREDERGSGLRQSRTLDAQHVDANGERLVLGPPLAVKRAYETQ